MKLSDLKELEAKASPGPWFATVDPWGGASEEEKDIWDIWTAGPEQGQENWKTDCSQPGYGIPRADAELIAVMRNHIKQLIQVAEAFGLLEMRGEP